MGIHGRVHAHGGVNQCHFQALSQCRHRDPLPTTMIFTVVRTLYTVTANSLDPEVEMEGGWSWEVGMHSDNIKGECEV